MNLLLAAALVAAAMGLAVGAMLLVRRRAPEGSYFDETQVPCDASGMP